MMFFSARLKGLFLLPLLLSIHIEAKAFENSDIQELDLGNCWLQRTEQSFKLASFPQGKSQVVELFEWQQNLSQELSRISKEHQLTLPEHGQFLSYLHCSSMGAQFMVELLGKPHLCLSLNLEGHTTNIMLAGEETSSGACQGVELGKLILQASDESEAIKISEYLKNGTTFHNVIKQIERERRMLSIQLTPAYITQEKLALELLQRDTFISESNPIIELAPVYFPIGSEEKLFRGSYTIP